MTASVVIPEYLRQLRNSVAELEQAVAPEHARCLTPKKAAEAITELMPQVAEAEQLAIRGSQDSEFLLLELAHLIHRLNKLAIGLGVEPCLQECKAIVLRLRRDCRLPTDEMIAAMRLIDFWEDVLGRLDGSDQKYRRQKIKKVRRELRDWHNNLFSRSRAVRDGSRARRATPAKYELLAVLFGAAGLHLPEMQRADIPLSRQPRIDKRR